MYTLMTVVALATSVSTATLSQNPTWFNDYATARDRVAAVHKPMAVFLGSGQDGWGKVVRDGTLDSGLNKLLAEKFVCLYVDTTTTAGRSLAGAFQVAGRGLVISDRTGTAQAYSLSGDLTKSELVRALEKYADAPEARSTETVVREAPTAVRPVSPVTYPAPPAYAPQYVPQYRVAPTYMSGST
ncbi:MAG: hypothetical protein J2P46_16860 [Zavarzinella sp.]|nr:hypothetical protein [Zavarzinella sp.]